MAKRTRQALSTGQAAKYCFVTPDTIGNWIKSGMLPAQRTAGGQYRITVDSLRAFMASRNMATDQLDQELGLRLPCWQYQNECSDGISCGGVCEDCLVQFLGALHCFKLMAMKPEGERADCAQCTYYRRWGEASTDLRWSVRERRSESDRRRASGGEESPCKR